MTTGTKGGGGSDSVRIRPMRVADLDAVLEIERASFPNPWSRGHFEWELGHARGGLNLVAEISGRVAGFLSGWVIAGELKVNNIAVAPDWRGRGIGRCLMLRALGIARRLGCSVATLEVRPSNLPARTLYRDLGFIEVGLRPGYYADTGEPALLMDRDLRCPLPPAGRRRRTAAGRVSRGPERRS